jgi:hypothetical protein
MIHWNILERNFDDVKTRGSFNAEVARSSEIVVEKGRIYGRSCRWGD